MGLFTKMFGGSPLREEEQAVVSSLLDGAIDRAGLEISYKIKVSSENDREVIKVNFQGEDEDLFTHKEGALLDAFQLFLKRSLQNENSEYNVHVLCDCRDYHEKMDQDLLEMAEKLKNRALDQGKSVYVRALPPKGRKVVHQFLAEDDRVKSHSVGEGLYKKIKIYPAKKEGNWSSPQ